MPLAPKIVPMNLPFYYNFEGSFRRESELTQTPTGKLIKSDVQDIVGGTGIKMSVQLATGRFISSEIRQRNQGETTRDLARIVKVRYKDIEGLGIRQGDYIYLTKEYVSDRDIIDPISEVGKLLEIMDLDTRGFHVEMRVLPVMT